MKNSRLTVLVTGVGAIIGYGIIKSLKTCAYNVRIIGMDIYDDAVGQHWCDVFVKAIKAKDTGYLKFLKSVVTKYDVDLVIPGTGYEMRALCSVENSSEYLGCAVAINNSDLVKLSHDKWGFYLALVKAGLPAIPSAIDGEFIEISKKLGLPMLLKPRREWASKGILFINDAIDFDYCKHKYGDQFMVQQIVGDDSKEYTVAAFGYGDGICSQPICMRRSLSREGATNKAVIEQHPMLEVAVKNMCSVFKPLGPTNFQFRFHGSAFYPLEINARISSSTSLRTAFGFNEAEMCIDYYLYGKRTFNIKILNGKAVRYIADHVDFDPI